MLRKYSVSLILLFTVFTFGAGIVNGLLGTGGGILLTYIISKVLTRDKYSPKDVFVCSMAAVIPISIFSLLTYPSVTVQSKKELTGIIFSAATGGLIGAILSNKLKSVILEKAFAIFIIYSGIRMLFR